MTKQRFTALEVLPEALADGKRLRRADLPDCERLTDLSIAAKAVWGYSPEFLETTRDDMTVTPERLEEEVVLLVERAGEPLGLVALGAYGGDSTAGEITMAFVHPDGQGEGIGGLLIDRAVALARKAGFRRLIVVSDPNAEGFYRRKGFQPAGLYHSEYIPGRTLPRLDRVL